MNKPTIVVPVRRFFVEPGVTSANQVLGHCERAAVSVALAIAQEFDARVIAISAGSRKVAKKALEIALRAGCDQALWVDNAEIDDIDGVSLARVLATAVAALEPDFVICGDRSQDQAAGTMCPAIAEYLDMPHLAGIIRVSIKDKTVTASTHAKGVVYDFKVAGPAVLGMRATAAEATLQISDDLAGKKIETVTMTNHGIDVASIAKRQRALSSTRPVRPGNNAAMAKDGGALVKRLVEDHLLE